MKLPRIAVTALLVSLTLTGCATGSEVAGGTETGRTETGGQDSGVGAGCESLEGCFSRDEMADLTSEMVPILRDFAAEAAPDAAEPEAYELVEDGTRDRTDCGRMEDTDFAYCPADSVIYLGETTLWEFYHDIGDAAAVLALGHEWGHHLQNLAGAPLDDEDQAVSIEVENQADCVGGAFQGYLIDQDVFEPDDVEDVEQLLTSIAESEDDPDRTHGTLEERSEAWSIGVEGGLADCNDFFPDTPLA